MRTRLVLAIVAAAMLGGALTTAAQVSSGSTNAAQQNAASSSQASEPPRQFPPPWKIEELADCFVVRDDNGQALSYVYFEDSAPPDFNIAKLLRGAPLAQSWS
jgi:hypothetical protein